MNDRQELIELEEKLAKGFEEAYRKMIEFKKYKNTPVIVAKNGKVVKLKPQDVKPTTVYKR